MGNPLEHVREVTTGSTPPQAASADERQAFLQRYQSTPSGAKVKAIHFGAPAQGIWHLAHSKTSEGKTLCLHSEGGSMIATPVMSPIVKDLCADCITHASKIIARPHTASSRRTW
jgi:hypothetical protein